MADKAEYIWIEGTESIALSAYRDAITFGSLCATAYFLNVMMPPSGWLNAALAICWFLWIFGKSKKRIMTPDQVAAMLKERQSHEG